jgi:hypothetical protein
MPKALVAGTHGQTLTSGEEWLFGGGRFNGTTEAQSQQSATEDCAFTGLRGTVFSGNSGTATFQFRDAGANGQNVATKASTGAFEDTTNTDTLTAGDLFNGAYTDTGTDSVVLTVGANVEFASGHGNFHAASDAAGLIMDVGDSTRYLSLHGVLVADGAPSPTDFQYLVREYTSIEAFQIRVNANARVNNSVFSINVNGVDVGTAITFGALATGLQVVTGMGIALSPGDLVCVSITLATGVQDLTFGFLGVTMKSTNNASAAGFSNMNDVAVNGSGVPNYFSFGSGAASAEANAAFKVGFAARCKFLRCYVTVNDQTIDGSLSLFVNGSAVMTQTIPAGTTGWVENLIDHFDITDTDVISFEVIGNDDSALFEMGIGQVFISFEPIPDGGEGGEEGGEAGILEPALIYGLPPLSPERVRAKYDEIEEIDRRIKAKEEAEREKVRKQQEAKRQLSDLEEKKRQTKTIAERKRKLEARIEAYQSEITDLRQAVVDMLDEMERAREEVEQQQMMADRRRRMLLLIAAAS